MAEYPSAQRILAELDGVWTDLTDFWIDDLTGSWGIQGNGPLDLVANSGVMRFSLNNMDQRFDPDSASALAGWEKGIRFKLELDYEGLTYRYLGTIDNIDIPLEADLIDRAFLTVYDWLEFSARDPIVNPGILINQRGDDVIRTLLGLMPIQPAATDLDVGINVFPTTFDTVTSHTKAYSELGKVADSEPGYIYLQKDRVYGETLVFESAHSRHGLRTLSPLPLPVSESGALLKEDGGYLLKEDGGKILLDQVGEFFADNSMIDVDTEYGRQLLNYFTLQANPRKLDASPQVLFSLSTPILIASGQTIELKGTYADPAGGLPINAQNMIDPDDATDYLMNSAEDGSGTNLTANLVLVSTPFGTEGFSHQLKNNSLSTGWLRQYDLRGYGIYNYNPISVVAKDQDSIDRRGTHTETLDQRYQSSLASGRLYIDAQVDDEKEPRTVLNKVTFLANQSPALMLAFLNLGPGSLIRVKHDRRGIDGYFYIQGISDFKITPGGLIVFTWVLKLALTATAGLSSLAVEFGGFGGGFTDAVNFGYIPHLANMPQRTASAWIYMDSDVPDTTSYGVVSYGTLVFPLLIKQNRKLEYYQRQTGTDGVWLTPANSLPLSGWVHVMATRDTTDPTSTPVLYINGVQQTLTVSSAPTGSLYTEAGQELVIGNSHSQDSNYERSFDGKIFDVRIYNAIKSSADAVTLYNSGAPDETLLRDSGLVFQPFYVPTKRLSQYIDATLTSSMKVRDAIYSAIGTSHGAPVGRTAP